MQVMLNKLGIDSNIYLSEINEKGPVIL
jgi:hypothetical protein